MQDKQGYFPLWRKFQDNFLWAEKRVFSKAEAWIDLLMQAQHKEEPQHVLIKMRTITCNYGECIKSLSTWGKRWRWSKPKVCRFLDLLQAHNMIVTKSETVTTRISICNYSTYDPRENGFVTRPLRDRYATVPRQE